MQKKVISINPIIYEKKEPVAWVTAHNLPLNYVLEKAGINMILAGDSGYMVRLGFQSINPVTIDEMITIAKTARRDAPILFWLGTYHKDDIYE